MRGKAGFASCGGCLAIACHWDGEQGEAEIVVGSIDCSRSMIH
jgi:hypothetical protein